MDVGRVGEKIEGRVGEKGSWMEGEKEREGELNGGRVRWREGVERS